MDSRPLDLNATYRSSIVPEVGMTCEFIGPDGRHGHWAEISAVTPIDPSAGHWDVSCVISNDGHIDHGAESYPFALPITDPRQLPGEDHYEWPTRLFPFGVAPRVEPLPDVQVTPPAPERERPAC